MAWYNSVEILGKLIPSAQILIVLLTIFTVWASVQRGKLEKQEKLKLTQEITKLQQKISPRQITPEQEKKLIEMLSFPADCHVAIASRLMDQESYNYAEVIASIFRKANWKIGPIDRSYLDDTIGDIALAITNDIQKETAQKIIQALNVVAIKVKQEKIREKAISSVQGNTIYLIVGSKK